MFIFKVYDALPAWWQLLHTTHVLLCALAVLVALIPLLTEKGSVEHRFGGLIYVPISITALTLASFIAWQEASLVLFCFNGFCLYLLLSGWRAVHQPTPPDLIDWLIPFGLLALAMLVMAQNVLHPSEDIRRSLCLMFFAFNGFWLAGRDLARLSRQARRRRSFFLDTYKPDVNSSTDGWLGRHIAGMCGSLLANLSVIVLTLLPVSLHWLWPAGLLTAGVLVALRDHSKKRRMRQAMARIIQPKFGQRFKPSATDDDRRRAA